MCMGVVTTEELWVRSVSQWDWDHRFCTSGEHALPNIAWPWLHSSCFREPFVCLSLRGSFVHVKLGSISAVTDAQFIVNCGDWWPHLLFSKLSVYLKKNFKKGGGGGGGRGGSSSALMSGLILSLSLSLSLVLCPSLSFSLPPSAATPFCLRSPLYFCVSVSKSLRLVECRPFLRE